MLAVAVEVTMILTLVGISYGTLDEAARRARGVGADIIVRPPASSIISLSSSPMSEKLVPFLRQQPHVAFATRTMGQPLGGFDVLTGIDLAQLNQLSGGFRFLRGSTFENDDDVIIDEYYARERKLSVGDTITLANHAWRVSGIFEASKLSHICARLSVLQSLTGNPGKLSQIYIKVDDPSRAIPVVDQLRATMPGYFIYTMEQFTSLLTINNVGLLHDFIGVVIGIGLVVGFISVTMAMYTAVLERTREIGILKALGASSGYILNLLFVGAPVVMRYTPSANLGGINLYGVVAQRRFRDFDLYGSLNWDSLRPNGQTSAFSGLGSDPFSTPANQEGQMYYVGVRYSVPKDDRRTKVGFEFNYGTKYWFNFSNAEDDIIAPKTNTRGDVYETFLTHRISDHFLFRADYFRYNYIWSGSGWHIGEPKKLSSTPLLGFPGYDKASMFTVGLTTEF